MEGRFARLGVLVLALSSLAGCAKWTRYDLGRMCDVVKSHDEADRTERQAAVVRDWYGLFMKSPATRSLLAALESADPPTRYGFVKATAADAEAPDWECLEMQAFLSPGPPEAGGGGTGGE